MTPQIDHLGKMSPVLMNPHGQSSIEALHTVTLYIYIYIYIYIYVTGPCLVGWHRYTRLTGRLAPC